MILYSLTIELLAVLAIVLYGWTLGRREDLARDRGWSQVLSGFVFLLLGSIAGLIEHFPSLSQFIFRGQATYHSLVEKTLVLCGIVLVAVGLIRWLPQVAARRRAIKQLRHQSAELEVKAETTSSELERSEAMLATVVASSPIILLATDAKGSISLARGSSLLATTGRDQEDLIERNVFEILPDLESDLRRALSGDTVVADVRGRDRVIRYRLGPRRDAKGTVVGIIGVGHDITDLDEKESQLREAKAAAETANSAKGLFVASMSHEIRTRLSAILGLSELLLLESPLPAAARECAERLNSSADGLASLIGNVLDFSKIEAGLVVLERVDFRLEDIVAKLQTIMAPQAAAKGLELRLEVDDDLPGLNGDPTRLLQVLVNLVGNSIKFTSEGHVVARLEKAEATDGKILVRCAVTDTGIGISPRHCARLFEPFTQADSSITRKFGGTGLRLTISKSLVELMGGTISIESVLGEGATFTFTATFAPPRDGLVTGELQEAPTECDSRGSRILVVEDNEVNRIVILSMLKALGHAPVGVSDGNGALTALSEESFDLAFMDCQMPELDGYQTTRALRHREAGGQRLPVIALTANVVTGERERCLAAGMDDFLTKPVRQRELSGILDRWLTPS